MPTHRRVKSKDEELGKRDDDMRPRTSADSPSSVLRPWRWRKRRMLAVLAGIAFLYVFIRNIPTDLGPVDRRYGMQLRPGQVFHDTQELREPGGPAPRTAGDGKEGRFYYEGPIKYYRLASSLNRNSQNDGLTTYESECSVRNFVVEKRSESDANGLSDGEMEPELCPFGGTWARSVAIGAYTGDQWSR